MLKVDAKRVEYPSRAAWLKGRRSFIGGSDAWKIVQGRWLEVWADKTGRGQNNHANIPMKAGHLLEPLIAAEYETETGREVFDPGDFTVYVHRQYPYIGCTVDRFQNDTEFGWGVLELKAPTRHKEPSCDEYWVQTQHQMLTTRMPWGCVATLPAHQSLDWDGFDADLEYHERLIEVYAEFWTYVELDIQPPADMSEEALAILKRTYPEDDGSTMILPAEMLSVDAEYAEVERQMSVVNEMKRPLEKRKKQLQAILFDCIRTAKKGVLPNAIYTRSTVHTKTQAAYSYAKLNRKEIA